MGGPGIPEEWYDESQQSHPLWQGLSASSLQNDAGQALKPSRASVFLEWNECYIPTVPSGFNLTLLMMIPHIVTSHGHKVLIHMILQKKTQRGKVTFPGAKGVVKRLYMDQRSAAPSTLVHLWDSYSDTVFSPVHALGLVHF